MSTCQMSPQGCKVDSDRFWFFQVPALSHSGLGWVPQVGLLPFASSEPALVVRPRVGLLPFTSSLSLLGLL